MYNLLVVDDEKLLCDGIRTVAQDTGLFRVLVAYSGRDALACAAAHAIDALFLDISMPEMTGIDFLQQLSRSGVSLPLTVIISGYDKFDYAKEAIAYGVVDYLLKPVAPSEVRDQAVRLHQLLEARDLEQAKNEKMRDFVLQNRNTIKQKLLYDILQGQVSQSLNDLKAVYGIDLSGRFYLALLVQIKPADTLEEVDFQVQLKYVEEALEAIAAAHERLSLFGMENARYVYLLCGDAPLAADRVDGLLTAVSDALKRFEKLHFYIGKGSEVQGLEHIQASYHHANEALDYSALFGPDSIYDISDYRPNAWVIRLEALHRAFAGRLALMQYDLAREALETYFDDLILRHAEMGAAQCHFYAMQPLMELGAFLYRNGQDGIDVLADAYAFTHPLTPQTLPNIKKKMLRLLQYSAQAIDQGYEEQYKKLAGQVQRIIAQRYGESDLSVNGIAEMLNYSQNHLNNIFKKERGMTIGESLNAVRIAEAKKLLEDTRLKVYDIAFRVGFNDAHYFSKNFKRQTGLSPKEYRERPSQR